MGTRPLVRADERTLAAAMVPLAELNVPALDGLDEICAWLGSFRERLRRAHDADRAATAAMVGRLEVRYRQRRAELS